MNYLLKLIVVIFLIVSINAEANSQKHIPHFQNNKADEALHFPEKQNLWVFIMAGQSNMVGRAKIEPIDLYTNDRILTIDKNNNWAIAKEPLHFYEPKQAGLDCGIRFGKTLLKYLPDSISIAMIPCAVGGSSVYQWLGDSLHRNVNLYSNFVEKINMAKERGVIKCILWHQGENDANANNILNYKHSLKKLFTKFCKDVGNYKLPIIVGEMGIFPKKKPEKQKYYLKINDIIHDVANEKSNVYYISSKGLEHKGDSIHFNSESQRELGKRYADKYLEIIKNGVSEEYKTL